MIIPVYLKQKGFKGAVDSPFYFLVANKGVFLVKDTDLYRACVEVKGVPDLLSQEESIQLKIPKIPKTVVETGMGFFKAIFQRHRSEGMLLLFFSPTEGFRLEAPRQTIYNSWYGGSYPSVEYENPPTPVGFTRLGTWHSHAAYSASHSREDHQDEVGEDGLHVVVGNLDLPIPSFSFSFMINGRRFLLKKEDVIEGYDQPIFPAPWSWLENVTYVDWALSSFLTRYLKK